MDRDETPAVHDLIPLDLALRLIFQRIYVREPLPRSPSTRTSMDSRMSCRPSCRFMPTPLSKGVCGACAHRN